MTATTATTVMAAGFNPLNATSWLSTTGLIGVFLVLLAETGLLVGFFLPGDSLLFTAGLLAATSGSAHLPLAALLIVAPAGAILGAQMGYWIGRTVGVRLLERPGRHQTLRRATDRVSMSINRYGPAKAVVLSRFIPVVRTVMNPMAGITGIPARVFVLWQVIGGLIWSLGLTLAGYWLGTRIPNVDKYLLPIVALIVVLSLLPVVFEVRRTYRRRSTEQTDGGRR